MLERIKTFSHGARNLVGAGSGPDAKPALKNLAKSLRLESNKSISSLGDGSYDLRPVNQLHLAIDHLTNIDAVVRRACDSKEYIDFEAALALLDREIAGTTDLLKRGVDDSAPAETAIRTLNLLFTAKQRLKQEFGVATELLLDELWEKQELENAIPAEIAAVPSVPQIILSSPMLFQLRQSLFPAERMIVGAARRTDGNIRIEALFDVTGAASAAGVKADPDRLAQALIAMSETGTHFGLWVHSHPGTGPGATHPSSIDIGQHADWLKDYSPNLVSAIMVKDGYIRFWGTAVESGKITVAVEGDGTTLVSPQETIYHLEVKEKKL